MAATVCHVILGAMSNKGMARAKCNDSDDHEEGDGRNHADRKRKRDWCGDPVLGHAAGGAGGRADPRGCPSRAILALQLPADTDIAGEGNVVMRIARH